MQRSTSSNPSRTMNGAGRGGYFGIASTQAFLRISGRQDDSYPLPVSTQASNNKNPQMQPPLLGDYVDAYFARCHSVYPVIHESTFRAQLMEVVDRPSKEVWHMLLYTVAALGAFSASAGPTQVDVALFDMARTNFSHEMMEMGNMALVQALALMSVYLRKKYKFNSSYNYLGLANRVAMGIGLYKDFSSSSGAPFSQEMRRRVWWCLYTLSLEDSIAYSRPQDFPQSAIEVGYPLNIHDLDLNPNTTPFIAEANHTTLYSGLKFGAAFYFTISKIYSRIISSPYPRSRELSSFDDTSIRHWESSLPSFFSRNAIQPSKYSFTHALLHWRCLNFRLLMYRPFVVWRYIMRPRNNPPRDPADPISVNTAITRCLEVAEETITMIADFWDSREQDALSAWYGLDLILPAVLVSLLCLHYDSASAQAAAWQQQVRRAMGVIDSMTTLNSSACHCLDIIHSLLNDCGLLESHMNSPTQQLTGMRVENPLSTQMPDFDDIFTHDVFPDYQFWEEINDG
ncbi:fungal specific transcription factor domain-containing protein [Aspergillus ibericus CBS 121593]|uniref:Xylanolytic transcriptional activator regulatory domain-containing protein n=1 Tax=Aspergillus ibericus CBS 121593 TaxID=1448316 RepID=A0A395GYU2_9EURO|nr:hypothetical protein BO80DRAFT_475257 [Aspergillus ibericus CBS 121593]RAL00761.1 hypothetical protein BO80DRAFT_475257 [Aspergillus ibericus CBS 121593]